MTDDRWAGAAVSRRMRLKTGGFAPTPPSTNMIMYKHHPVDTMIRNTFHFVKMWKTTLCVLDLLLMNVVHFTLQNIFYITLDHIDWACFARYISNAPSAALS